ncbi:hypothetical protein O7599_01025 [Streptomyces sp. WMMC500]|uniref:hypothetical protein n=1 Tax=Streptomyces sp. WMMC500 TaxID=3015154 RepID=UPI00248B58C1|nr:hypothetical protein [Streptomyces sp. WMMC500]WBB61172.1 hypothetical protein O7599_01025 [Streptomyces sp. WMMC500]
MRFRLADGVVTTGQAAWAARAGVPVRLAEQADAPAGAPVALGPPEAGEERAEAAVAALRRLVAAGGPVAAGAGVDLGGGFRSARLAGARGDKRDAVLAALRALGPAEAGRLGDRAATTVALFGPAATKRVGAAAGRAVAEGRWPAVRLASAASDVLGPEQVERILALEAPDGVDPVDGGAPSVLAGHLGRVLAPLPGPRRPALLTDLWDRVLDGHARQARRARLLATQGRDDRVAQLRTRRTRFEEELARHRVSYDVKTGESPLLAAARWTPSDDYWHGVLNRIVQDAQAATVLLRTAVAVADHGPAVGLAHMEPQLAAAVAATGHAAAARAARRVPGLTGLPARPAGHARELQRHVLKKGPAHVPYETQVRPRLARARDYALVVVEEVDRLLDRELLVPEDVLHAWAAQGMEVWRRHTGYTPVRPPEEWAENPPWVRDRFGTTDTLADRLRDRREKGEAAAPRDVEVLGDLLWYAELADALAQLHGHEAASCTPRGGPLGLDHDPPPAARPLEPRLDSVSLAVSGAAQLAALGGTVGKGVKTWAGLVESLRADVDVATALSGEFPVPPPLAAVDATLVPGTRARFRLARSARTLAEWADYMGNCIATPFYVDAALKGRSALAALQDDTGRILVNAELRPARPAERGWLVGELAGRFNDAPDEALEERFRRWVATLPGTEPPEPAAAPGDEAPAGPARRRRAAPRLVAHAGPELARLAERAWAEQVTDRTAAVYAALAATLPAAPAAALRGTRTGTAAVAGTRGGDGPAAALTRLRRLGPASLAHACRRVIGDETVSPAELWAATGVRPLAAAVTALDPALRDRFEQLELLDGAGPLPKALRALARRPAVAPAYAIGLMGLRVRAALGRLVDEDDPALARVVSRRPPAPLLCAAAVAVTCRAPAIPLAAVAEPRAVTVPGFPASSLDDPDGPWQRAFPAARELGADTATFWDGVAAGGLRAPASWLAPGGWPALWSRAHR